MIHITKFPTRKKIIQWEINSVLPVTHVSNKSILISSGCSFTDQQTHLDIPLYWPGYLVARCQFDHAIDLSSAGAGNEYISTSILNQLETMTDSELKDALVIIVWSGVSRLENLIAEDAEDQYSGNGYIDAVRYIRPISSQEVMDLDAVRAEVLRSWKNIIFLENYLKIRKISYGFSLYFNMFDPPFLPRPVNEVEFTGWLDAQKIDKLRKCQWLHKHKHSLYEFCFEKDQLLEDFFHPNPHGSLDWTDKILIPSLEMRNLVSSL